MSTKIAETQTAEPQITLSKKLGAEVFGTFLLVFGGLGTGLLSSIQQVYIPVALTFGLSLMIGIFAVGHISGGHFNPAVTIGAFTAKRFDAKDILPYIAAQLIGACLAMGALYVITLDNSLLTSDTRGQLFGTLVNQYGDETKVKFGLMAAFLIEAIVTAIFVAVILSVTSKKAPKSVNRFAPVAIGFTLAVMINVALPITNASLNPARSTAAAVVSPSGFHDLWLFWVAPIFGAIVAGLVFRMAETKGDAEAAGTDIPNFTASDAKTPVSGAADAAKGAVADAKDSKDSAIDSLAKEIKKDEAKVADVAKGAAEKAEAGVKNAAEKIEDGVKNAAEKIEDGAKKAEEKVEETAKAVKDSVKDATKKNK